VRTRVGRTHNRQHCCRFYTKIGRIPADIDEKTAIEVKATDRTSEKHLKSLATVSADFRFKNRVVVSLDPILRRMGEIDVLPYGLFLEHLWAGKY